MIPKLNFNIPCHSLDRAMEMRYFSNFEVEICCSDEGAIELCSDVSWLKVVCNPPIRIEKFYLVEDIQVCKIIFFSSMAD
jgi:hypothetical protein